MESRLAEAGRITFAEFMALALYGPGGYYRRAAPRIGPEGDFYTSPTVHPAFGALLGGCLADYWHRHVAPGPLEILELGCGRGTLAADLRLAWRDGTPALLRATQYSFSDFTDPAITDTALTEPARKKPDDTDTPITDTAQPDTTQPDTTLPETLVRPQFRPADAGIPDGFTGVVLGNELLDALPVHRVRKDAGKLREIYVSGFPLAETLGPLSSDRVAEVAEPWADRMPEGASAEVPLAMLDWLDRLAAALLEGIVLLIDYGAERDDLLARHGGTLRGFRRHRITSDPYAHVGATDLTCHVDFTALRDHSRSLGFAVVGEASQAAFLEALGLPAIREAIAAAPLGESAKRANLAALHDLVSPRGLGAFRVMALAKNRPGISLAGLTHSIPPLCAPALTKRHMALWGGGELAAPWRDVDPADAANPLGDLLFEVEDLD
jgi:SAM-dependent MidA family methyltransferase